MSKLTHALGIALLLLGVSAQADVLHYTHGGGSNGALEEVTFLYKGLHKMVEREDVKTLTLGKDGTDVLVVKSGKRYSGKLVALRFRTSGGATVVGRGTVKTLTLDGDWTPPEPAKEPTPEEKAKTEEQTEAEKAKADALKRNQELGNACAKKARELEETEKKTIDAKYAGAKKDIEIEVKSLLRSIDNKLRRRRESKSYRNDRGEYNDGIDRDYRSIEKAKVKRKAILAKIKKEKADVEKKAEERVKRIKVVWSAHRRAIAEGNPPEEEQMFANYKKALQNTEGSKKK